MKQLLDLEYYSFNSYEDYSNNKADEEEEQQNKISNSKIKIVLSELKEDLKANNLNLNKKITLYSFKSEGKLDIYFKAHLLKVILESFGFEKLNESFYESLKIMENDLLDIIKFGEGEKLNENKYLEYVEIFVKDSQKIAFSLKMLKRMLVAFQNLGDKTSIKYLERLFIQLLGHSLVKYIIYIF